MAYLVKLGTVVVVPASIPKGEGLSLFHFHKEQTHMGKQMFPQSPMSQPGVTDKLCGNCYEKSCSPERLSTSSVLLSDGDFSLLSIIYLLEHNFS